MVSTSTNSQPHSTRLESPSALQAAIFLGVLVVAIVGFWLAVAYLALRLLA